MWTVSGTPNDGENAGEATAAGAALGTRKEQGKVKAVTEEGEAVKADSSSHRTGGMS